MKKLAEFISTLFYFGNSPVAPGTIGSLAALIIIFPLVWVPSISLCFFATVLATTLGFIFIPFYLQGKTDDLQEIVIDEAAGLYLTILLAMIVSKLLQIKPNYYILFILCFILFRLFDITKPSVIGYFDRTLKGAVGIMMDDLIAGIFAGVSMGTMLLIYKYCYTQ
jgi:phosphatidylglycerophosphatase A